MPITVLPTLVPSSPTFRNDVDTFFSTQLPTFCTEANTLAADVQADSDTAQAQIPLAQAQVALATAQVALATAQANNAANSASLANSAAGAAGAILWVSATYAVGDTRSSPSDLQTYRCKTAGSRTIDPALDSTNWTRVILGAGTGGTVATTGNVILTNSSGAAQSLTTTTFGSSVTLPDARTCSLSGFMFNLYNNSAYPFEVFDYTGGILGFLAPYSSCTLSLSSNSTVQGTWNTTELLPYAVTASQSFVTAAFTVTGTPVRIALDYSRTLLVFTVSTPALYGVIYDSLTRTWGSLTLIRTAVTAGEFSAILSASNQVLVTSCDATTGFQAVTLTTSGTAITVNTAATATLAGNLTSFQGIVQVGTSFVVGYSRDTTTIGLRGMTISGTTVTVGSELAPVGTSTTAHLYAVSSSVVLAITATASTGIYATPYSISGSALTLGTAVTLTTDSANSLSFRSFIVGTRYGVVFNGTSSYISASVITVTGSVATASTVQDVLSLTTNAASVTTDVCVIGDKFLLACGASTTFLCNTLTVAAGVLSKGTVISFTFPSNTSETVFVSLINNNCTFLASGTSTTSTFTFSTSGTSPVFVTSRLLHASGQVSTPQFTSTTGIRSGTWFKGSGLNYGTQQGASMGIVFSENILETFVVPSQFAALGNGNSSISGSNNEVWIWETGSLGSLTFQKVECVL